MLTQTLFKNILYLKGTQCRLTKGDLLISEDGKLYEISENGNVDTKTTLEVDAEGFLGLPAFINSAIIYGYDKNLKEFGHPLRSDEVKRIFFILFPLFQ